MRAVYKAAGGLSDFVKHLAHGKTALHQHIISFEGKRDDSYKLFEFYAPGAMAYYSLLENWRDAGKLEGQEMKTKAPA